MIWLRKKRRGGGFGEAGAVRQKKVLNPKIVMAVATEDEVRGLAVALFRVRVRDASKFVPGNRLEPCRLVQADLYSFEGVAPRRRGRV